MAALFAIDQDQLEDWILANAPEFVVAMKMADHDVLVGETLSWDEVRASLSDE